MFLVILACVAVILILFVAKKDPLPIGGVYRQPGKWYNLKYFIFNLAVTRRKRSIVSRQTKSPRGDAGYGVKSRGSVEEMESVQQLPAEHPLVLSPLLLIFCI